MRIWPRKKRSLNGPKGWKTRNQVREFNIRCTKGHGLKTDAIELPAGYGKSDR
jgi:hypothetical protein